MNAKKEPYAAMIIVLALICLVVARHSGRSQQRDCPAIAANTEATVQESLTTVLACR